MKINTKVPSPSAREAQARAKRKPGRAQPQEKGAASREARSLNEYIRLFVEKVHPRDPQLRAKSLTALDQQDTPPLRFLGHAADAVAWSYGEQLAASFNQYAALTQAAVVVACFAFAPPQAGLYALGAVLIALSFRDAFTHQDQQLPEGQYYLDSAGDAAAAGVFVIAAEGLAVVALPSLSLPSQVLYRGLLVSMPLIATLRMVLRAKSSPGGPEDSRQYAGMPAKKLYRRTRWLNFLWLLTVYGVVLQSVSDKPGYFPDFLRGFLPMASFGVWKLSQVDDLCRRDNLVTLFTSVKAKTLRRMRGNVAAGANPSHVNYSTFVFFQVLLFGVMALTLFTAIEPFVWGEPFIQSIWHAAGAVLAFMVSMLSWKRVKEANRAAARALLEEARKEEQNSRVTYSA